MNTTRRQRWWGALVVGLVVLTVVVLGPPGGEEPLDPSSAQPDGLRGLVELLDSMGVDVDVGTRLPSIRPDAGAVARVFVPQDLLGEARRRTILAWVADGGTLVVAGRRGELHGLTPGPGRLADRFGETTRRPGCAPLEHVGGVAHGDWATFELPEAGPGEGLVTACFASPDSSADGSRAAWLVARPHGEGTIVAIGSAAPFTNAQLDGGDNAVLAATLLGPRPGDDLLIVPRPAVGEGDTPVLELVPDGFWRGLVLLAVATVMMVVWRARRLGPPVQERLPDVLPGAETARSLAGLLQRAGAHDIAARRLRDDARATAIRALGLPASTPPGRLAELVASRGSLPEDIAARACLDRPVHDDAELTAVAAACAEVRAALSRPTSGARPR